MRERKKENTYIAVAVAAYLTIRAEGEVVWRSMCAGPSLLSTEFPLLSNIHYSLHTTQQSTSHTSIPFTRTSIPFTHTSTPPLTPTIL